MADIPFVAPGALPTTVWDRDSSDGRSGLTSVTGSARLTRSIGSNRPTGYL